jgi:pyruvate/2-oxoacid:ferredoxin oxidoreductase alpha subunit
MSARVLLTGNHAVAWGARLARPQVVPVYPITPQTPVLELLTEFQAAGELDAEFLTPESEHSVMAASIPASLAGARVFTATASQGLMFMHEVLHYASGARAPIVMANVNRTVASPWAFWPDQTDSLAQRDTGWVQLYVESAQEALDTVIQGFRIAESVSLPVMLCLDAFYVSHALEPVLIPAQALVDEYLPPYKPEHFLDPQRCESWGNVVDQATYCRHRRNLGAAMDAVPGAAALADREWGRLTGREWGVVERYRCQDAALIVVTMGSMAGTAREAIDALREAGQPVGLVKVRLFRPFPAAELRAALEGARDVVVLDRNFSPGAGGVLHQELKSALYGMPDAPRIHGFLAGVGGVNVPVATLMDLVRRATSAAPVPEAVWT